MTGLDAGRTALLTAKGLAVSFGGLKAVKNVSIDVARGSVTALIGPNGAGKSTFVNLITGFIRPDSGSVKLEDVDVSRLSPWARAHRGMVRSFQNLEVFGDLTIAENVALGVQDRRYRSGLAAVVGLRSYRNALSRARIRVLSVLDRLGLLERADDLASELSYGEQKLLVVGRLLATECELLIFDEPGAGLPASEIVGLGRLFRDLAASGHTVLFVDHNMELVMEFSDRVHVMHHGELIASGTPHEIRSSASVQDVYLAEGMGDN